MILPGRVVDVTKTRIVCGAGALKTLQKILSAREFAGCRVFILVDSETGKHCLPLLAESFTQLNSASVFEVPSGEASKSLFTAEKIWSELIAGGADRQTVLLNLGGGVVSDLGGFVAAGLKRGIRYINIPTSLMGMADAAIGGKTAVNLGQLKNQVGFFYSPSAVLIDPVFLKTLPQAHIRSGFAEIIKSALIGNPVLWHKMLRHGSAEILSRDTSDTFWMEMLSQTVSIKNRIASRDFREVKLRKVLNFGHSIGHALESYFLKDQGISLLHGEAVAIGMMAETWLSHEKSALGEADAIEIISFIKGAYNPLTSVLSNLLDPATVGRICSLLAHDKKNRDGNIRMTLIESAGKPRLNIKVSLAEAASALQKVF
ncbi:MAG: 3-dehydroquinate synthase family protein [Bacteroidota bacterium]